MQDNKAGMVQRIHCMSMSCESGYPVLGSQTLTQRVTHTCKCKAPDIVFGRAGEMIPKVGGLGLGGPEEKGP